MDLKKMSGEELYRAIESKLGCLLTIKEHSSTAVMVGELLSRLEELEKENKMWREKVTDLEHDANEFPTTAEFSNLQDDYEELQKKFGELEKQVEGLKCCGNCIEYFIIAGSFYPICNCEKNKRVDINPYNKCDHWRYDTITADERRMK
jgi:predicted RNase H-like nuclease (RuvC/YqgF family)